MDGTDSRQKLNNYKYQSSQGVHRLIMQLKKMGRIQLNQIDQITKKYQSANRMVLVFIYIKNIIYIYILIRMVYKYFSIGIIPYIHVSRAYNEFSELCYL